nr:MAG TPA: hypothetical protein [Caudoviricetes sp.]
MPASIASPQLKATKYYAQIPLTLMIIDDIMNTYYQKVL